MSRAREVEEHNEIAEAGGYGSATYFRYNSAREREVVIIHLASSALLRRGRNSLIPRLLPKFSCSFSPSSAAAAQGRKERRQSRHERKIKNGTDRRSGSTKQKHLILFSAASVE